MPYGACLLTLEGRQITLYLLKKGLAKHLWAVFVCVCF